MSYTSFRNVVWRYYQAHGRHDLPWRPPSLKLRKGKQDEVVYRILVSEVMLQQTQVERVIPFFNAFIKKYPTARRLAAAPLQDVLAAWSGLGYNRRAKLLREAAKELSKNSMIYHTSRDIEKVVKALEKLPGVGPYTARAVAAFAYNADVVFVETNIRTAVIHHFFRGHPDVRDTELVEVLADHQPSSPTQPRQRGMIYHTPLPKVSDTEIKKILGKTLPRGRAREWYSALMDYGAHLKRSGVKVNTRGSQYAKQAKFEGSLRQVRGAIVKALTAKQSLAPVKKEYPDRFAPALAGLAKDGLIKKGERGWRIT